MFFLKNHAENGPSRIAPDIFLLFKKALNEVKAIGLAHNKNELYKTLDCWPRDMLNFDFLKSVWEVSPPYFMYDFQRKMFLMLYSINWPHFIV